MVVVVAIHNEIFEKITARESKKETKVKRGREREDQKHNDKDWGAGRTYLQY